MPDLELLGCRPEPLMGYLKALGIFRLVAEDPEHGDPTAKLSWKAGVAHLTSKFDRDGLCAFFLKAYRPTPILAPWNGGSGFYGGGAAPLDALAASESDRLALYRDVIAQVREIVPETKPKDEDKEALLVDCRAKLPDEMVPWLDVCFVLSEDGPSYFPLLGTGGNDGRLDFTNNFMQRVADVLPADTEDLPEDSEGWLSAALFADSITPQKDVAIGQFFPGGLGGANGVQGDFEAGSRVNPWDFVLMIEGSLLFAGSVARRMGTSSASRAVFPFSVDTVAVGYGSATASEETTDGSRSELWLPLWDEGVSLPEVRQLFAEGRAQFGRRQAKNAVEFALAVSLLGVSRGISSFSRYGFLKRNGLAYIAAPLGRMAVTPHPAARLLEDPPLTEWVDRLRSACRDKDKTPARYQTALRAIDRATFGFASRSESGEAADRRGLVSVLQALGRAERTLAGGIAFCKDKYIQPLQRLSQQWLTQADDGSRAFRLAASLASLRGLKSVGLLRVFLEEVETKGAWAKWSAGSTSAVWSTRPLADNLASVFRRRQMEAFRDGMNGVPLDSACPVRLEDVVAFLHDPEFDDDKLHDLTWGLCGLNWAEVKSQPPGLPSDDWDLEIPFEFGLPRLVVQPRLYESVNDRWRSAWSTNPNAVADPEVFNDLASGRPSAIADSVDRAARRLKTQGLLTVGYRNRQRAGKSLAVQSRLHPTRLLAAMLFPLAEAELDKLANAVLNYPEAAE